MDRAGAERFERCLVLVCLTIRVIASIYGGNKQNSEMEPIGVRPHAAQRLDRKTVSPVRHPDRELKMTAWLTVLTSMFALVTDAWPKAAPLDAARSPAAHEAPIRAPRIPLSK